MAENAGKPVVLVASILAFLFIPILAYTAASIGIGQKQESPLQHIRGIIDLDDDCNASWCLEPWIGTGGSAQLQKESTLDRESGEHPVLDVNDYVWQNFGGEGSP